MWLHGTRAKLAEGELILSAEERSAETNSLTGDALAHALALGQYRQDRVYVFDAEGTEARDHRDRFTFTGPAHYIYEVEPIGTLEPDLDRTAPSSWRCCRSARVIQCLSWPR